MDEDEQLLERAEDDVAEVVARVLAEVADEFAAGLDNAARIVAARFSVSDIGRMFRDRAPRIIRALLGVVETGAATTAASVDAELPDTWEDLPDRWEDGRRLPAPVVSYVSVTEHLLRAVGTRLAEAARRDLAEGVAAGEDMEALRARLRETFARESSQLGEVREERVARTEAGRAWNTAVLGAAQALTGPERPLVKQWRTRGDERVRHDHDAVDGQLRLLDESFTVGGVSMATPHDPTAPAKQVVNCRCVLRVQAAARASAFDPSAPARAHAYDSTDGGGQTASADGSHLMGAMIALIPADANAEALALEGGEDVGELHLTLFFLGDDADDWTEDQRRELIQGIEARAAAMSGPVHANAFGVNHWNPASASPCWVWAVGDDYEAPDGAPTLHEARNAAVDALEDMHSQPGLPFQHSPWAPHVCAAYTGDTWPLEPMAERVGPLVFDRIRVAFGGEHTDIPLGPQEEPTMEDTTAAAVDTARLTRAWTTPGDAALAYEDTETGDGRLFAPDALYWEDGPWPLQYADEMGMGHEGAELAGAIEEMGRDAPRITGSGVVYTSRRAGADAEQLLDEGAPLGVSVDLDDVDMQVIDRTATDAGEDEGDFAVLASARLASASVLRMADGAYCITASTGAEWTADGGGLSRRRHDFQVITNPGGTVPAPLLRDLFGPAGPLTAAAGDSDSEDGMILWEESAGDLLIRFTRARVRGATLVAMPAYANARIVLEPLEGQEDEQPEEETAAAVPAEQTASADVREQLVAHVLASAVAVSAGEAAAAVGIPVQSARSHLANAAREGDLVRIAQGQYVGSTARVREAAASAVDDALEDLTASAWRAMQDLPPMPAEWFREPTAEELPPGSGGVHYKDGRVFGWVAQAGVPHVGYPGKSITIERLAREGIDYSKFLRANFRLDDGTTKPLGAMTMNVGHHRDGAQCETAACQFDNSGTVGAIVTIGMNAGGMWFSGAAAPWLSDWDRSVFLACQPSYHLKSRKGGGWELGAILDVPNPGHPSPLVAAVVERGNLALAASAAAADIASGEHPDGHPDVAPGITDGLTSAAADQAGHRPDAASGQDPDEEYVFPDATEVAEAVVAAMLTDGQFLDSLNDALEARVIARSEQRDEIDRLAAQMDPTTAELAAAAVGAPTGEETG